MWPLTEVAEERICRRSPQIRRVLRPELDVLRPWPHLAIVGALTCDQDADDLWIWHKR